MPADELAATAAAALATLPINKPAVLPSGGSVGTTELPLFAGGALQPPEAEKNSYSNSMLHLIATQKRPPAGGTSSRRRVPDSELDMAVVTDQLCNRRYHVKEMSQNMKVGVVRLLTFIFTQQMSAFLLPKLLRLQFAAFLDHLVTRCVAMGNDVYWCLLGRLARVDVLKLASMSVCTSVHKKSLIRMKFGL